MAVTPLARSSDLRSLSCSTTASTTASTSRWPQREGCQLVTADRRLHDKVERSPFAGLTLWIGDVP